MGYIKACDRFQVTLFPETLDEYIAENNPVRVIDVFVNNLDLKEAGFSKHTPAKEGRPGYDPRSLLKLYIYGYFYKIRTSRKLMAECVRNVELMWLMGKLTPDFRTIADFRKDNPQPLKKVFKTFGKICMELKLYEKELIAIDGSKFKAVNSKDRNLTLSKVEKKLKRLEQNIDEYLTELDKNDEAEGETKDITKEELQEKINLLKQRQEEYNKHLKEMKENNETQRSFTDSESRLMRTHSDGFNVCYNVQTAVDAGNHMIVDFEVTNSCNDSGLLSTSAISAKKILGTETLEVVADNGYESTEDMLKCLQNGIIPHVALKKGVDTIEISMPHEKTEITLELLDSTEPEDIEKCLKAGVLPTAYERKNIEIQVIEMVQNGTSDKCFVLNEDGETVTCPEGKILNKSAYLKNKKATRFVSRSACSHCMNKCTASKFKQVDLKDGQRILYLKGQNLIRQVVIRIKPDKGKIKKRKCVVEHPYGTIKHWCDGSYLLLKGRLKATADLSLSFLCYNLKRAINIVGVKKLIEQMTLNSC